MPGKIKKIYISHCSTTVSLISAYPEYYEFIEKPMDLTTLKSKISSYTTIEEAISDLRIIWDNCRNFNAEDSPISNAADELSAQVESSIEVF